MRRGTAVKRATGHAEAIIPAGPESRQRAFAYPSHAHLAGIVPAVGLVRTTQGLGRSGRARRAANAPPIVVLGLYLFRYHHTKGGSASEEVSPGPEDPRGETYMNVAVNIEGTCAQVGVTGSLNTNTASQLEAALEDVFSQATSITFDFDGLEYVSSAGLRVLMMAFKRLGGQGVAIEHASDEIREVLDITGFSTLFDVR